MVTTQTNPSPPSSTRPRAGEPPSDAEREPRRLGRRPSLPAGRAIVGGLLVTIAAIGTFAAYANATAGPTHTYVVAAAPVRAGQRLQAADLRTVALELPDGLEQQAFSTVAELEGATALAPIDADQLLAPAAVRLAGRDGPGRVQHELSFALDRDKALGGRLQRGELIDAVATYGSGADAYSRIVVRQARVIDVDSGAKGTVGSSGKVTITIALDDDRHVLAAMHAIEIAKVTLVRTTGDVEASGSDAPGAVVPAAGAAGAGQDGDADTFRPAAPGATGEVSGGGASSSTGSRTPSATTDGAGSGR